MIIKSKNRIAFTLAEMMIVVLIVSVLSAAILPSITTRRANDDSNVQGATIWSKGVNGLYYVGNATRKLFIGADAKTFGSNKKLEYQDEIGDTTLMIYEETPYSDSRLFFYDSYLKVKNGVGGGTRLDEGKNIGIGREMLYGVTSTYSTSNIAIGDKPAQLGALNTGHHYFKNSIMIGTATGNLPETNSYANNAIFIGYSAARFSSSSLIYANNIIAIGTYAMYYDSSTTYKRYQNDIAIGAYASTKNLNSLNLLNSYSNNISIGAYASYTPRDDYVAFIRNGINIGAYAKPLNYQDDINIGYYAAYNGLFGTAIGPFISDSYCVNIGAYANSNGYTGSTLGKSSLTKSVNIGHRAASGERNVRYSTIIGAYAGGLFDSTISTGTIIEYSVAIGNNAIANSTSAYGITAIGSYAGQGSKNQRLSTFVGYYAGYGATFDTADGKGKNVYIGQGPGRDSKGYGNVYIGRGTGFNETGNYNLYIGSSCRDMNYSYVTCLFANPRFEQFKDRVKSLSGTGYSSGKAYMFIMPRLTGSNWGNTWITLFGKVYGPSTTMTAFSDKRLKENIVPTKYGIDKLRKVNVYNFNMKNDPKTPHIGVIAQEIKNIYPQAVIINPNTGFYNVQNDWILYSLLQSIKDVDNSINKISDKLTFCIKNIAKLAKKVANIEQRLDALKNSNNDLNKKLLYLENNSKKMEHK